MATKNNKDTDKGGEDLTGHEFGLNYGGNIKVCDLPLGTENDTTYLPFDGVLRFERDGRNRKTINIPRSLIYHSPTGLEWGYGGSGPADTALNVLYFFTKDKQFSMKHHQEFKKTFIATVHYYGGTIALDDILEFIKSKQND